MTLRCWVFSFLKISLFSTIFPFSLKPFKGEGITSPFSLEVLVFIFLLLTLRQISLAFFNFSSIDLLRRLVFVVFLFLFLSLSLLAVMIDYEDIRLIAF